MTGPPDPAVEHGSEQHRDRRHSRVVARTLLRRPHIILLVLAFVALLYGTLWSYRFAVAQLGPFAPLAAALLLGLILVILGPWLLLRYRAPLQTAVVGTAAWLWKQIRATGLLQRTEARFPRLSRFLAARLARDTTTGLGLTIGFVVAGAVFWEFVELLIAIVVGGPVVGADRRIINLVATLRTPALDRWMLAVTFLGNAQTIVALAVVAVAIALLARRRQATVQIILSLVASSLFFGAVKAIVSRPRPLLESARIVQGASAFQAVMRPSRQPSMAPWPTSSCAGCGTRRSSCS